MADQPARPAEDVRPLWETCSLCNYDRHRCPGCGTDVPHGTYACDECNQLAARNDGIAPTGLIDEPALNDGDCQ